ncbi:MAG: SPOR domain-containing protein [Candidatus Omnitrophica bacterium]|nr:SPOR domain-containing protein [Candidatus Omnitrophota bacterium]
MSSENNKNKDKSNVRITENDIQKKLYGNYSQPMDKEKLEKGKFSEDFIKNKLYGSSQTEQKETVRKSEPAPVNNDLFSAKKPETAKPETVKLETARSEQAKPKGFKPEVEKIIKQNNIAPEPEEIKILPVFQDEINALKLAIANLEDKLQRTELQKHKLKVKLVQKRKLINIREGLADLMLNKMPEKFVLLLSVIIIMFLLVLFMKFIPQKKADSTNKPKAVNTEQSLKAKPIKSGAQTKTTVKKIAVHPKPQATTDSVRRFTIQVAEYADEAAAMSFVKELEAKGFEVFLNTIYRGANNTRPYFKINVGSFDTFNEAKQYNTIFREKTNINDSFIRESK